MSLTSCLKSSNCLAKSALDALRKTCALTAAIWAMQTKKTPLLRDVANNITQMYTIMGYQSGEQQQWCILWHICTTGSVKKTWWAVLHIAPRCSDSYLVYVARWLKVAPQKPVNILITPHPQTREWLRWIFSALWLVVQCGIHTTRRYHCGVCRNTPHAYFEMPHSDSDW